jgi:hypothetical protein
MTDTPHAIISKRRDVLKNRRGISKTPRDKTKKSNEQRARSLDHGRKPRAHSSAAHHLRPRTRDSRKRSSDQPQRSRGSPKRSPRPSPERRDCKVGSLRCGDPARAPAGGTHALKPETGMISREGGEGSEVLVCPPHALNFSTLNHFSSQLFSFLAFQRLFSRPFSTPTHSNRTAAPCL